MKMTLSSTLLSKSLPLLVLFSVFLFSSCHDPNCIKGEGTVETRTLPLSPFTKIEVNGDFKVYLTQGAVQQVEVKGEPNILSQLETSISNNTWKIEHSECVRRSKTVEVYITMPELQEVYLNGSGRVTSKNTFTATDLPVALNGSGKIELSTVANLVATRLTGSGEIVLTGDAERHTVTISGSGRTEAYDLKAKNVTVNLSGSGAAQVSASTTLDVTISGSGNVYYQGSPTVTTSVTGSGKVIRR